MCRFRTAIFNTQRVLLLTELSLSKAHKAINIEHLTFGLLLFTSYNLQCQKIKSLVFLSGLCLYLSNIVYYMVPISYFLYLNLYLFFITFSVLSSLFLYHPSFIALSHVSLYLIRYCPFFSQIFWCYLRLIFFTLTSGFIIVNVFLAMFLQILVISLCRMWHPPPPDAF
jgi:hypothetical protein